MSNTPVIPQAYLEQAAQFKDPCIVINVNFPGVRLPAQMLKQVTEGKFVMLLNAAIAPFMRTDPELRCLEFEGVSDFHIPGGAILSVVDRSTGEAFVFTERDRSLLKEAH